MPYISKKLIFAIEAVLDVAYDAGAKPVTSIGITHRQGIRRRYLEPVLQELVRAKILRGVRGPYGGYLLARERRKVTLAQIADAVANTEAYAGPFDTPFATSLGQRVVRPVCFDLAVRWSADLDKITIEDLWRRARELGIPANVAGEPSDDVSTVDGAHI